MGIDNINLNKFHIIVYIILLKLKQRIQLLSILVNKIILNTYIYKIFIFVFLY